MRKQFISDVSHELKTPISLIQGYAEGLIENVNTDEESRKVVLEEIYNVLQPNPDDILKILNENLEELELEDFDLEDIEESGKRVLLDENGVNIYQKSSKEKTVEERIKTSRSLKIKYNNWNNVDWCEDNAETFTIDPMSCQFRSTWEDVEFEKKFYETIFNSKYKSLLLGEDKITVNYQTVNEILFFVYAKLKVDYSLSQILVMLCEYCGINIQTMWKKLSSYAQMEILNELREVSKLPKDSEENKLF